MRASLDIFRDDPQGPIWLETVAGLTQANERLTSLNELNPSRYFVYDILEKRIVAELPDKQANQAVQPKSKTAVAGQGGGEGSTGKR